ncbi:MAG: DUF721 domain-containing protein, partial [Bacteroidota bacterium]
MARNRIMSLGEAIDMFLKKNRLKDQVDIQAVIEEWEVLMGQAISSNTEKIWFQRGVLYVKMTSPVWKQELTMARSKIKELVNRKLKRNLVEEVR